MNDTLKGTLKVVAASLLGIIAATLIGPANADKSMAVHPATPLQTIASESLPLK